MIALEAGKYTFEVDTRAHKLDQTQLKAFEGVKSVSVNTVTLNQTKRVDALVSLQNQKAIITYS